jgi:oligopeptidase B
VAKRVPHRLEAHGHERIDDYYWLRERDDPDVIAYLEVENAYHESRLAHTNPLQERLFDEIKGRIKEDDSSAPSRYKDFFYYTRFEEGKSYPLFCRKPGSLEAAEQVMLDVNALAQGREFCQVSAVRVSEDQRLAVYGVDFTGRRFYTLRVRDLSTGGDLEDLIADVTGNAVWANDHRTLFYTRQDPVTLRAFQVFRHTLGTPVSEDVLVYEEADETFSCGVYKTKSRQYIVISSRQTLTDESRYLPADDPAAEPVVFAPRERGLEYDIDHNGDFFYVRTNYDAKNFRLMRARAGHTSRDRWEEVVPHRPDTLLEVFELFRDYLVLGERREGLARIRVIPWDGSAPHEVDFGESVYEAGIGMNPESETPVLRYGYTSMTTPNSVYDYDMSSREKTLVKRDEVLGGYDPADYMTERLWATARDGARVPISIVYRTDFKRDGAGPLLLSGYGSYGFSGRPTFSSVRLSLLDRGFAYAIAHIRGGSELGRAWYEDGRQKKKMNTFTDFIDCAEHLVNERYTSPAHLYATGGSAGGLLMGAVMNLRPDLFHGIVTRVPFVDIVTTMLDADIPLTTNEYDEWGDPNREDFYRYILAYSPYDNVEPKTYPNVLVTTGLHDSQVQYWEPAKWVAKLRAMSTGGGTILLKTDMQAGHGGASGRYEQYRETALNYAFLLDLEGAGK